MDGQKTVTAAERQTQAACGEDNRRSRRKNKSNGGDNNGFPFFPLDFAQGTEWECIWM